jgi:hypothetical protein
VTELLLQQQPQGSTGQMPNCDKLPSEIWRIWHAWANCKKEEHYAVLQDHFRKMAQDLKLPEPVATFKLTNLLYTLFISTPFKDKLEYGVQLFAVAYLSQKSVAEQWSSLPCTGSYKKELLVC